MRFLLLMLLMGLSPVIAGRPALAAGDDAILPAKARPLDDCVGNPVTPICAILTHWACVIWRKPNLCHAIDFTTRYMGPGTAAVDALGIFKFRIVDRRTLTAPDIPSWTGNVGLWVKKGRPFKKWRPGDLAVRVEHWNCTPRDQCVEESYNDPNRAFGEGCPSDDCGRSDIDKTYVLRRTGSKWQLLYYHFEPDDHGAFWDAFWKRK